MNAEVASKLRQRARSFRADADTLAALPVLQEPLASGLDPDQWALVYREIAHVLHDVANEYDGRGAA